MDGIASLPTNGVYSASKIALEGLTAALWLEIEPIGLRAFLVEPGSFRTGIEQRTHFSRTVIPDYDATSGAFIALLPGGPGDVPGDPARVALTIDGTVSCRVRRRTRTRGLHRLSRVAARRCSEAPRWPRSSRSRSPIGPISRPVAAGCPRFCADQGATRVRTGGPRNRLEVQAQSAPTDRRRPGGSLDRGDFFSRGRSVP